MFYVNVYEVGTCYGGPEEGGWWYPAGEPVECCGTFETLAPALKAARQLRERIKQPDNYRMGTSDRDGLDPEGFGDDLYLTLGGAWGPDTIHVSVEEHMPLAFPESRPYYD